MIQGFYVGFLLAYTLVDAIPFDRGLNWMKPEEKEERSLALAGLPSMRILASQGYAIGRSTGTLPRSVPQSNSINAMQIHLRRELTRIGLIRAVEGATKLRRFYNAH